MSTAMGFTGTREGLTAAQGEALRAALVRMAPREVHHGDCVGADAEFVGLVRDLLPACRVVVHPPLDGSRRAFMPADVTRESALFLERNHRLVNECEVLVACPLDAVESVRSGTWATVRYARRTGKPVLLIYPDGTSEGVDGV